MTSKLRLALVDDHAVVRQGLRRLLELEPELDVVAEFGDAESAQAALLGESGLAVEVLILDVSMPGRSGLELLRACQMARPELKVVMLSMHDTEAVRRQCALAGAVAFVSKSADPQELIDTLLALPGAEPAPRPARTTTASFAHESLTAREWAVFEQLIRGASLQQAAQALGVSEKTVSNNQTLIRQKLQVGSAMELLQYAQAHGLLP